MLSPNVKISLFIIFLIVIVSEGWTSFYTSPTIYYNSKKLNNTCNSNIKLFFNKLSSNKKLIPYSYDYFDFCKINNEKKNKKQNIGQILLGQKDKSSFYNFEFLKDDYCHKICTKNYIGNDKNSDIIIERLKEGLAMDYHHYWIVDNIPVTWCYKLPDRNYCNSLISMGSYLQDEVLLNSGYDVDRVNKDNTYYLFNHVDLTITYESGEKKEWGTGCDDNCGRIIAVEAVPRSINHRSPDHPDCSSKAPPLEIPADKLKPNEKLDITYTYSIYFKKNNTIKWSSRWNYILNSMPHTNIHLSSIIFSFLIFIILTGSITWSFINFKNNFHKFGRSKFSGENQEEHWWNFFYYDIFISPKNLILLSALLGSGVQIFFIVLIILIFSNFGLLSPVDTGSSLLTVFLVFYVILCTIAGNVSSRIYKRFGGKKMLISHCCLNTLLTPGFVFILYFSMNLIHWKYESSAAIPLMKTIIIFICLLGYLFINIFFTTHAVFKKSLLEMWNDSSSEDDDLPNNNLSFIDPSLLFRKDAIEDKLLKKNQNVKDSFVEKLIIFVDRIIVTLFPFSCILIQSFFILNSIWADQVYSMFGILFINFIIFVAISSASTIFLCFSDIRRKHYNWMWNSFLTSGFTAVYLFIYCINFFFTKLEIEDTASTILYFGYTLILVFLFFLLTGSIGFFACFWFIRKIHNVIKL
ncbi:hypothetical protein HCN44_009389 [Aphidius gifuensis]|uniref:Transmembrane 9 superfamily member n=1 Tax=Aphidius gifuensis TaxID=684658 RepID=A0A834Y3P5_APHGI|nr:transmembrane 9 superfamily member 2-like [Aphidius gifuensis]KAF7997991.1 hypothetical protein HCN44_009389 [Aphidius gifuensis]